MSDDTFEVEFRTTGQSDAVRAFEELKLKELAAKQQTGELSSELRKLQRSGTATAQEIEDVSRSLVRAQQSTQNLGRQAGQLQQSMIAQNTAVSASVNRWESFGGVVSQIGGVVGRLSPALAGVGQTIAVVGGSVTALTGSLGPVAMIMAGVTVAAQALDLVLSDTEGDLDGVAGAADGAAESMHDLAVSFREINTEQNLLSGMAGTSSVQSEIADVTDALHTLDSQRATAMATIQESADASGQSVGQIISVIRNAGGLADAQMRTAVESVDRLDTAMHRAQVRLAALQAALPLAAEVTATEGGAGTGRGDGTPPPSAPRTRTRSGGHSPEEKEVRTVAQLRKLAESEHIREIETRERAEEDAANHQVELWTAALDAAVAADAAATASAEALGNARVAASEKAASAELEASRTTAAAAIAENDKALDAQTAAVAQARENQNALAEATTGAVMDVAGSMNNFIGQTIDFLQQGGDLASEAYLNMLDNFLESTAIEYTIRALAEAGQAIASFASQDYSSGAQHLAAAAVYGSVAVLAGAGAAAINVPAPQQGAPQQVQSSTPLSNGGGQTNVTNLYAPQAVFTETERAEIINGAQRAMRRERGTGSARI